MVQVLLYMALSDAAHVTGIMDVYVLLRGKLLDCT